MRILMYIHASWPVHAAGAETMIWNFGQEMIKRGHQVKCIARGQREMIYEGVEMMPAPSYKRKPDTEDARLKNKRDKWFRWADIVWTHLGQAGEARLHCERFKKPLIHLVHNTAKITPANNIRVNQGFIFNSETLLRYHYYHHEYLNGKAPYRPYTVVRPTIDPSKYKTTEKGNCYTLINLNINKGGWQFYQLSQRMKHKQFLGVQGMYGHQVVAKVDSLYVMSMFIGGGDCYIDMGNKFFTPSNEEQYGQYKYTKVEAPNFTYQKNMGDMVSVYNRTRILLIMSESETWGRTASEAMCNGIPVIYSHVGGDSYCPTDGLHEHVGSGGVRVKNRNNLNEWQQAIEEVEKNYEEYSQKALARYQELGNDYQNLEDLNRYMVNWSPRTRTVRI